RELRRIGSQGESQLAPRGAGRQGGGGASGVRAPPRAPAGRGDPVTDEITLLVPAEDDFRCIAHLVGGGLRARLDLTYEDLDDLQAVVDAVLGCRDDAGTIEIRISLADGAVRSTVGPFSEGELNELETESPSLGLRRVLETVTDGFEIERHQGEAWVVLSKHTKTAAGAAG